MLNSSSYHVSLLHCYLYIHTPDFCLSTLHTFFLWQMSVFLLQCCMLFCSFFSSDFILFFSHYCSLLSFNLILILESFLGYHYNNWHSWLSVPSVTDNCKEKNSLLSHCFCSFCFFLQVCRKMDTLKVWNVAFC